MVLEYKDLEGKPSVPGTSQHVQQHQQSTSSAASAIVAAAVAGQHMPPTAIIGMPQPKLAPNDVGGGGDQHPSSSSIFS
jgi:hypothetical protein